MDRFQPEELTRDDAFEALASERRRAVVDLLLADPDEYALDALADELTDRDAVELADPPDADPRDRLQVVLMHRDLPRLDEDDVVDFDPDERTVEPGEHIDDLDALV